ncbi:cysteine dioxygenase family protein [Chitinasiproducens palmae]|uniref:Predicted metal-dependent enzyme of the double-stranded beta helix superfamily n=1 Tax=Chitinasiproducens palmae TaxID=1770053 RepID=A0A1H2PN45_9BURK|nr:cysteine dioxygenase family protein [Chitinasiproducens palmae]SDV48048.1 Predicted metal-dependent enzyme of the double-stranded beta helix superfamily [Chitinasiproducens palmae]
MHGWEADTTDNRIVTELANALNEAMSDGKRQLLARLQTVLPTMQRLAPALTRTQLAGCAGGYAREPLYLDPAGLFSIVLLTWRQGQHSPVHAHWTWCGYVVLRGELTERLYRWQDGAPRCRAQRLRRAGDTVVVDAGHADIHRLGNEADGNAVSLHVYGVDGAHLATHVNRVFEPA